MTKLGIVGCRLVAARVRGQSSASVSLGASRRLLRPFVAVCCEQRTCAGEPGQKPVDFNFEIRPILSDKCFKCHGPDPRNRKAGLQARYQGRGFRDHRIGLAGPSCPAIWKRASSSAGSPPVMRRSGCRRNRWAERSRRQKSTCSSAGSSKAPAGRPHWSFLPPAAAPVPPVDDPSWAETRSIDSCWRAWTPSD